MTYIGPPWRILSESYPLYIIPNEHVKNLVAMPTIALTHIQNKDPGPPNEIATATPAIFPIPTVLDNAVDKA